MRILEPMLHCLSTHKYALKHAFKHARRVQHGDIETGRLFYAVRFYARLERGT